MDTKRGSLPDPMSFKVRSILVIAVGYGHEFHAIPFIAALLGLGITMLMQWLGIREPAAGTAD